MADAPETPEEAACPACGETAHPRAPRCPSCGEPLTEDARTIHSSKNLMVFILLAMALAFATVYYMRARARSREHRPPPGSTAPELGIQDAPGDRDRAPVRRVDPEVGQ